MTRKSLEDLGKIQRAVMEVLWETGEATVNQVRDRLSPKRTLPYTTVLSAMQKLEKAGWLRHRAEGRTYVYQPKRTREQEGIRSLGKFIDHVFRGDPLLLFHQFIKRQDLSDEDLANLRKMIDKRRKEIRNA